MANVDQVAIVASAAEPRLKPNLIDRLLVTAEKGRVRPVVCINKIDLVEPADLQPLVGVYSQMGYEVLLLSAKTGFGIERFRRVLAGPRERRGRAERRGQVVAAERRSIRRCTCACSRSARRPRKEHTTTTARLLPLACGGYVVDTPGIRQFQLWDVIPEEVAGFFRDLRPYVSHCRFPDCTHTHEDDCAVKDAVADGRLDERRYESYCHLLASDGLSEIRTAT